MNKLQLNDIERELRAKFFFFFACNFTQMQCSGKNKIHFNESVCTLERIENFTGLATNNKEERDGLLVG
jgi:sugar diacid utilization regulator